MSGQGEEVEACLVGPVCRWGGEGGEAKGEQRFPIRIGAGMAVCLDHPVEVAIVSLSVLEDDAGEA